MTATAQYGLLSRGYQFFSRRRCFASVRFTRDLSSSPRSLKDEDLLDDQELQTHHVRQDNHDPLPLPPFLNPKVKAARERWTKQKPLPSPSDITSFREKVNNNPYAHALATPIRSCTLTDQALPNFFLRSLVAKAVPGTTAVHLLPIKDFSKINSSAQPARTASTHFNSHAFTQYLFDERAQKLGEAGRASRVAQAISTSSKGDAFRQISKGLLKWREDMADLYLELSQTHARRTLALVLRNKKTGDGAWAVAVEDPYAVSEHANVACMLYVGGPGPDEPRKIIDEVNFHIKRLHTAVTYVAVTLSPTIQKLQGLAPGKIIEPEHIGLSQLQSGVRFPPVRYPTMQYGEKKVAVYHVWDLLGEAATKEVLTDTPFKNAKWIALKESKWTRNVQMQLMRIQGYLETPI